MDLVGLFCRCVSCIIDFVGVLSKSVSSRVLPGFCRQYGVSQLYSHHTLPQLAVCAIPSTPHGGGWYNRFPALSRYRLLGWPNCFLRIDASRFVPDARTPYCRVFCPVKWLVWRDIILRGHGEFVDNPT
jgi:hypothetical protein